MPFFFLAPPLGYYRAERFQPDRVQLVFHYNKYLKMENAQRCGTGDELASIFTAKKMRENIAREMNEEKNDTFQSVQCARVINSLLDKIFGNLQRSTAISFSRSCIELFLLLFSLCNQQKLFFVYVWRWQ